jgi:EmrB/QacA subfamily drug resistance transporter
MRIYWLKRAAYCNARSVYSEVRDDKIRCQPAAPGRTLMHVGGIVAFGVKEPCDAGVILGKPSSMVCSPSVGRWVLAATILGSSMAFIDSTAVNIALPVLQVDLGASVSQVQWIVEAYALFLAALLLVGGSLGDRIGRRKVFAWGVVIFAGASLWCALAPDPTQLIIARAVQGVGGALLVPGSLAIISASFDESSRGKAIGTWSGFSAITMAIGPVFGGWLVENIGWRWVFYLNLPIAIIVLAIILTKVPETRDEQMEGSIDWLGAFISVVGLGALIYGLIESANLGLTHPVVVGSIVLGITALGAFAITENKVAAPMMPLTMLRSVGLHDVLRAL